MHDVKKDASFEVFGLNVDWKRFDVDAFAHRHNEVEMIFVDGGPITLVYAGRPYHLDAGSCAVFWAIVPHFALTSGPEAVLYWAKAPLSQFLLWNFPAEFEAEILKGSFLLDPSPRPAEVMRYQMQSWKAHLTSGSTERTAIALLEIEACLREMAVNLDVLPADRTRSLGAMGPTSLTATLGGHVLPPDAIATVSQADRMLSHIALHYQEPLTVEAIATAAGLQRGYAMRLFRARFGMTLVECINRHRISHAQRLLLTTTDTVLDILLDAGFGSVAQFYAVFARVCGCSPVEYRKSLQ